MNKQKRSAANASSNTDKWAEAKRLCRLSTRQVEMAQALGMNPKKLPGLRPSPSQQWKVPVGQFIEECYAKRFGDPPLPKNAASTAASNVTKASRAGASGRSQRGGARPSVATADGPAANGEASPSACAAQQDAAGQATDLMLYLVNLANDIESTLAAAAVTPELLAALSTELHAVATRLAKGAWIAPLSEIDRFVFRKSNRKMERERGWLDDDGDIPF